MQLGWSIGNCGRVRWRPWRRQKERSARATRAWLFFMQGRPAHARCDGGLIEFALNHVLRAPVVKAEHLVVDVKSIHDKGQATGHFDATLSIELKMGIEEVVAGRPRSAVPVTGNILSVIGKSHSN